MARDVKWHANWLRMIPAFTVEEKMRNLEAADLIEELEARIPRWISVKERPPGIDKSWTDKDTDTEYMFSADLLVYDGIRRRVAYYCHTTKLWYDSRYEDDIIEVTHWMLLPELPTKGE